MSLSKRAKYALLAVCVLACLLAKLSVKQWIASTLSLLLGYLLAHLTLKRSVGEKQAIVKCERQISDTASSSASFETQFRRAHPWQSVYLAENVDKALEELMSMVIQNFVLSWYSNISTDDGFVFELKSLIQHALACLVQRAKKIDFGRFLTQQVNTILFNHVHDFYQVHSGHRTPQSSQERIAKQSEMFKQVQQVVESGHVAMWSRRHELSYLRQVCKRILPFILPDNVIQSRVTLELIEEITVSNLLLKSLDILAEPESINKLVIKAIESHYENSNKHVVEGPVSSYRVKQVQILKHWCHMNGAIFRSIQAPSFRETIENDEIMHIFINYLNSTNSISVLQLYLMLKDMIKSYNETDGGDDDMLSRSNLLRQIEELRVWCESNRRKLDAISFNHELSYYSKLTPVLSTNVESHQTIGRLLGEIFADLTILLKDVYYLSFIKSEYMYKNLIGLNKLAQASSSSSAKSSVSNHPGKIGPVKRQPRLDHDNDSVLIEDYFGSNQDDLIDEEIENDEEMDEEYAKFERYNKMNRVEQNLVQLASSDDVYDSARAGSDIRFDLINEINDEFNEEESPKLATTNQLVDTTRHLDHYEDDDDEEEELQKSSHLNLNNLRIAIDEIDEVMDKSSQKICYVFVIKVWHLPDYASSGMTASSNLTDEQTPSWSVRRKYDEFYVLDSRLKEFHGGLITSAEFNVNNPHRITVQLPPKQRSAAIFFNAAGSNSVEFLDSVRDDFAKYLQSLLANPILSMSQLIKAFLDPQSIEFSSSILNDITSLGKMVKGVPYKLRVERGQSLDTFLQSLCNTLKQVKHKSSNNLQTANPVEPENILESRLQNEKFKSKVRVNPSSRSSNSMSDLVKPFETLMFLVKHIYKLPEYACVILFSLRCLIQQPFDNLLSYLLDRKMKELAEPESLENIVRLLKDVIFGENDKQQVVEMSSEELYAQANQIVNKYVMEELLGLFIKTSLVSHERLGPGVEEGTRSLLEAFQYPLLNKNVTYQLLDGLLRELFPELDSSLFNRSI